MKATVRALAEGDYDGALEQLLEAWETTRAPALATLIGAVSARANTQHKPLPTKEQKKALLAWVACARAKRASGVELLLEPLVSVLATGPAHVVEPRLDELLLLPPDPRIAPALVRAVAGPLAGWNRAVAVRVVKALVRHGDARLTASFQAALDARVTRLATATSAEKFHERGNDARFASVLEAWAKLKAKASAPPAGIEEVDLALKSAPSPLAGTGVPPGGAESPGADPAVDGDALLAAIHADLSDDARRLVYADHLSAAGDPRGEFIMLQFDRAAGRGSPTKDKREKALLKAHAGAWLGGIAADVVVVATEWDRGFPVATKAKPSKLSQAETSFIRPEWITLERVRFGGACLLTEPLRNLREAYGVTETAIRRVVKQKLSFPQLSAIELRLGYRALALDQQDIAAALAFPALRRLAVHFDPAQDATPEEVERFCEAVGDRLESLIFTGGGAGSGSRGGVARAALVAPFLARGGGGSALRALGWGMTPQSYAIARRDAGGDWSTLEVRLDARYQGGRFVGGVVEGLLQGLPPGRFEVGRLVAEDPDGPGAEAERILATVATRVERVAAPEDSAAW